MIRWLSLSLARELPIPLSFSFFHSLSSKQKSKITTNHPSAGSISYTTTKQIETFQRSPHSRIVPNLWNILTSPNIHSTAHKETNPKINIWVFCVMKTRNGFAIFREQMKIQKQIHPARYCFWLLQSPERLNKKQKQEKYFWRFSFCNVVLVVCLCSFWFCFYISFTRSFLFLAFGVFAFCFCFCVFVRFFTGSSLFSSTLSLC